MSRVGVGALKGLGCPWLRFAGWFWELEEGLYIRVVWCCEIFGVGYMGKYTFPSVAQLFSCQALETSSKLFLSPILKSHRASSKRSSSPKNCTNFPPENRAIGRNSISNGSHSLIHLTLSIRLPNLNINPTNLTFCKRLFTRRGNGIKQVRPYDVFSREGGALRPDRTTLLY